MLQSSDPRALCSLLYEALSLLTVGVAVSATLSGVHRVGVCWVSLCGGFSLSNQNSQSLTWVVAPSGSWR